MHSNPSAACDFDPAEVCSVLTDLSHLGPSASADGNLPEAHPACLARSSCLPLYQLWPTPPAASPDGSAQQGFSSDLHAAAQPQMVLMPMLLGQSQLNANAAPSAARKRGGKRYREGKRERSLRKAWQQNQAAASHAHSDGAAPQRKSDAESWIEVDLQARKQLGMFPMYSRTLTLQTLAFVN
eukprot:919041-Amphidinium_carterae.1